MGSRLEDLGATDLLHDVTRNESLDGSNIRHIIFAIINSRINNLLSPSRAI
jgi:hypothetical protein